MLGWSINLFRIRGIQLSLHVSFLMLIAYVAWVGWSAAGWLGLGWMVSYVLLLFTCVVLHELGHSFTARRFGVGVPRIMLLPIGGMAEFDSIPKRPRSEILIALAGPAVNFLIVGVLILFVRFPEDWNPVQFPLTIAELWRHLVVLNLVMGIFNLVPVFPMDGGRVFRAMLATRLPYLRATFIAVTLGKVLSVLGALTLGLVYQNWLGAALFTFIFVAGELEYRGVKRRELDEERLRELLAQLRDFPPPLPPPSARVTRS